MNAESKSSIEQIRERFDNDVERFSNFDTGQTATIDAKLTMELIARAAAAATPGSHRLLDVGCGAGNYALSVLKYGPNQDVVLLDISAPMLERANVRVQVETRGTVTTIQADIRDAEIGSNEFDTIVAAMTLHHLRTDDEWRLVFSKLYGALQPGGSLWIADLIEHTNPGIQGMMWQRYGDYLVAFKGEAYRDHVFGYIEQEDTPKPLIYQLDLLRSVGFSSVDVLHKNSCFAAFGGIKHCDAAQEEPK